MCGIVAIISKKPYGFTQKDIEVFDQLLLVDQLRGNDSTGVITVEADGGFHIDKEAVEAAFFLLGIGKLESRQRSWEHAHAMIGHNRKSTIGKTSDNTAHPFVVKDRFALVHNGTLWQHKNLGDTEVDSEALAQHLDTALNETDGSLEMFEKALSEVDGAYATIWYNQKTKKIQMVRNHERPLSMVETPDCYYIASEAGMLYWILSRNSILNPRVEAVPDDTLYTFDLEKLTDTAANTQGKLTTEKLTLKKPTPTGPTGLVGDATVTTVGTDPLTQLSKNKYKGLRNRFLGKKITFNVTDYVATYYPQETKDYYIMGSSPEIEPFDHMIKGEINTDALDVYAAEYLDHYDFEGIVSLMEYDRLNQVVEIFVTDIKRAIPKLIGHTNENSVAIH